MDSILSPFLEPNNRWASYGLEHLCILIFYILLAIVLIRWARRSPPEQKDRIARWIGWSLFSAVLGWSLISMYMGVWDTYRDLPFAICNLSAFIAPMLMTTRNQWLFQVLYFWVMFGTLQANITPDLNHSFPHYQNIKFWMVHCGVIIGIFYLIFVYGYRPKYRSIWISAIVINIYLLFMYLFNVVHGTNHMYVLHKPPSPTLLDAMGDWPWYILHGQWIGLLGFHLVWLPWGIEAYLRSRKQRQSSE